jgi:hypothetical protein
MYPSSRLKLNAVFFATVWTIGMLCWDGSFDRANVVITAICGALLGLIWYRVMRRRLSQGRLPARR